MANRISAELASASRPQFWKLLRGLGPPAVIWGLLVAALLYALYTRIQVGQQSDLDALREWLNESRVHRKTLPELVREYLALQAEHGSAVPAPELLHVRAEAIQEHLAALGNPTKIHQEQLPLFPIIYRLELDLRTAAGDPLPAIVWDSNLPRPLQPRQLRTLDYRLLGPRDDRAIMHVAFQLHAYNKRQEEEATRERLLRWVIALAVGMAVLASFWAYFFLKRERERELRQIMAHHQIEHAEKLLLENELRRQEAERKHQETERRLLEERVAAQAAEQKALELRSQMFQNIGITAGSYAHNIKNLLVRPNDLLQRCLESDGLRSDQRNLLEEVGDTLHTVTDRLQQILKTVRRDPTQSEFARLDLNALATDLFKNWQEMAEQKWKLTLSLDLAGEPLWLEADASHLTQAMENLLFNARDATFEMRSHEREEVRRRAFASDEERRQALIAAAGWRGSVRLRTRREGDWAIFEVQDNGIGMTPEVRRRCTEAHFSTKRDNALYSGNQTGMGLGLWFTVAIVEGHRGLMEISSEPLRGALFQLRLPLAANAESAVG